MSKYLSEEFIEKILDAHLEDSRGAEHYAYDVVKRELMSAPGADVVEVKHGRWIEEYVYAASPYDRLRYKCSLCGRTEEDKEDYCHCGAKMYG